MTMSRPKIKDITLLNEGDHENREVLVTLDNGTEVHITACHASWQQWGGTTDELYVTMPVANRLNGWLHPTKGN